MSWGAAIAAGASLLGTAASVTSAGKLNRKNRAWQEKMWNMTNEYNAPSAQMLRFKEAGLNPHLIYGQGNSGNANMAQAPKQELPEFNFGDVAQAYIATRKQQTEIDNLEQAKKVQEAEELKKSAETAGILVDTARKKFDLKQAEDLRDMVLESAKANLNNQQISGKKLEAEIINLGTNRLLMQSQIDVNSKQGQKINAEIHKMAFEIADIQSRIALAKANRDYVVVQRLLGEADLKLRANGINWNDPFYGRIITSLLGESGIIEDVKGGIKTGVGVSRVIWDSFKNFIFK